MNVTPKTPEEMTVTVKQTVESTFNVFLPHFRKCGDSYYKVITENSIMKVSDFPTDRSVGIGDFYRSSAFSEGSQPIEQEEFDSKLKEVLTLLSK